MDILDNGSFWKLITRTSELFGTIAGSLTVLMMLTVVRDVIGRYFFNAPTQWAGELNCYFVVALAYLGAAYTETVDGHVRMDVVYDRLHGKKKAIANIFINIIGIFWIGVLFWQGGKMALHSYMTDTMSSDAMMWPLWPSQMMVPLGTLLLGVVLICKLIIAVSLLLKRGQ